MVGSPSLHFLLTTLIEFSTLRLYQHAHDLSSASYSNKTFCFCDEFREEATIYYSERPDFDTHPYGINAVAGSLVNTPQHHI